MTPEQETELRELYEIVLKTARRAVRDLNHMSTDLKEKPIIPKEEWKERIRHYELVLGGTAEYRQSLINVISNLEYKLQHEINKTKDRIDIAFTPLFDEEGASNGG